jgi:hypothetical protein
MRGSVVVSSVPKSPSRSLVATLTRLLGLLLLVMSMYPFWECLRTLDRREYVSALLAVFVGWILCQAGIELVRPESAE